MTFLAGALYSQRDKTMFVARVNPGAGITPYMAHAGRKR